MASQVPSDSTKDFSSKSLQEKNIVKGPVGVELSFKEANDSYMSNYFPGWKENSTTYVVPPVYKMHHEEIPVVKAGDFGMGIKNDYHGQIGEGQVLETFVDYGYRHAQPMFIFHGFIFNKLAQRLLMFGKNLPQFEEALKNIDHEVEIDLMIVHRKIGIILVETKTISASSRNKCSKYKKAEGQLNLAEFLLQALLRDLLPKAIIEFARQVKLSIFKKVMARPEREEGSTLSGEYIILCKHHLNNFSKWWKESMIEQTEENVGIFNSMYSNLIPLLVCRRDDICVPYNDIAARLDGQLTLEKLAEREIKIARTSVIADDTDILQSKWMYLTPEQCAVWNKKKQVICGPYGCGKTVLIQCKAASLARSGEKVLVIVPKHLKICYKNFFKDNGLVENSKLRIITKKVFHRFFLCYKDMALSSHVFIDELLSPHFAPYDIVECYDSNWDYDQSDDSIDLISRDEGDEICLRQKESMNFFKALLTNNDHYHVWVAPHLYGIIRRTIFGQVWGDAEESDLIIEMCKSVPISRLTTVMRTTKQINDYKTQMEWENFVAHPKRERFFNKYFEMAFNSNLGHAISGPTVKTFSYPAHYKEYDERYPELNDNHKFCYFAADVIKEQIGQLLQNNVHIINKKCMKQPLQPRHIVVVVDYYSGVNLDIQELLHERGIDCCTIMQQQEDTNKVASGISRDIASLQWPVVIHLNSSAPLLSLFETDWSLIISRCMVQYIVICQDDIKSHQTSSTYNLDTDQLQGTIETHDFPTLYDAINTYRDGSRSTGPSRATTDGDPPMELSPYGYPTRRGGGHDRQEQRRDRRDRPY